MGWRKTKRRWPPRNAWLQLAPNERPDEIEHHKWFFFGHRKKRGTRHRQHFAVAKRYDRARKWNVGEQGNLSDSFARPDQVEKSGRRSGLALDRSQSSGTQH